MFVFMSNPMDVVTGGVQISAHGNDIINSNPADTATVIEGTRETTKGELDIYNGLSQFRRGIQHDAATRSLADPAK